MNEHGLTWMYTCWSDQRKAYKCAVGKITTVGFTQLKQHTARPTAPGGPDALIYALPC